MVRKLLPLTIVFIFSGFLAACQTGTGGFKSSLVSTSYGISTVSAKNGAPVRFGDTAQRFEVRAGDCGSDSSWSDCANDRERAELSATNRYAGGTHWYGWSMFVPNDYQNASPVKVALGQFHSENSRRPPIMFQNYGGGLFYDYQLGDIHTASSICGKSCRIIEREDFRGKWHDIVVQAKWTKNPDGFVKIWVNGELKIDHTGITKTEGDVYFKYGIYRTFVSRHMKQKGTPIPTQVVYYDEVRHGSKREDVDIRIIEKQPAM